MLIVVKKPRIEISINGEGAKEAIDWLARKFRLNILSDAGDNVNAEDFRNG